MLCFSNFGKVYWKKVYEFPQASRASRGRPINNLLPLEEGESITAMLPVRQYDADHFVFMATSAGVVKKTSLEAFSRPRTGGIIALELDEGDKLIAAALTDGKQEVMLFSDAGKAVRFNETNVRSMGRTARGVRGMKMQPKQKVISLLIVPNNEGQILTATERGYGKRTVVSEYRTVNRGAQGVVSIQTTPRNGKVVSAIWVEDSKQVMLITNGGVLVRTRASEISLVGRNTQGVRLINLGNGESLVAVQPVDEFEGNEEFIESEIDNAATEETVSE
jgi:DNA gyrase subunit A